MDWTESNIIFRFLPLDLFPGILPSSTSLIKLLRLNAVCHPLPLSVLDDSDQFPRLSNCLYNTLSLLILSVHLIFIIRLQHHISNASNLLIGLHVSDNPNLSHVKSRALLAFGNFDCALMGQVHGAAA